MSVDELTAALGQVPGVAFRKAEPLGRHVNLRLGGEVEAWIVVEDEVAASAVAALARRAKVKTRFLVGFSDLVAQDEGLGGVAVRLGRRLADVEVRGESVHAGVGAPLARIGAVARGAGLGGLAALERLPGTVWSWMEEGTSSHLQAVLVSVRALEGRGIKVLAGSDWCQSPSSAIPLSVELAGALPPRLKGPPPPGAIGSLDGDLPRRMVQSGLTGIRLRGLRLSPEQPGVVVNLGASSARDLEIVLRMVKDRLQRDHGMELKSRLSPTGRSTRREP